jgi:hypothetical protein
MRSNNEMTRIIIIITAVEDHSGIASAHDIFEVNMMNAAGVHLLWILIDICDVNRLSTTPPRLEINSIQSKYF